MKYCMYAVFLLMSLNTTAQFYGGISNVFTPMKIQGSLNRGTESAPNYEWFVGKPLFINFQMTVGGGFSVVKLMDDRIGCGLLGSASIGYLFDPKYSGTQFNINDGYQTNYMYEGLNGATSVDLDAFFTVKYGLHGSIEESDKALTLGIGLAYQWYPFNLKNPCYFLEYANTDYEGLGLRLSYIPRRTPFYIHNQHGEFSPALELTQVGLSLIYGL